jgi:hypothetical protein
MTEEKKDRDIFEEIGEAFKELGKDIKPHLFKAEQKIRDFDEAIQPSLADIGDKLKELGSMLKKPGEDLTSQVKEWSRSLKPVLNDMGQRVKSMGKTEEEEE